MTHPIVIVGAGQAGIKAAETLRAKGCTDPITLIGEEPWLPYQRPPLSKAFLMGKLEDERLYLKSSEWLEKVGVTLKSGVRATGLDTATKTLALASGQQVTYSQLLLATGTTARTLSLPGSELEGVVTLRSIDDSKAIAKRLADAKRVVIVGGGFIGMEVAAAVRAMDVTPAKDVTVIEAQDRILKRAVAPELSRYLHKLHTDHGVHILTQSGVARFQGDEGVEQVVLSDGRSLDADLVLVSAGALPATDLAQAAGIEVDHGIVVDDTCQTSAPGVFAAGDCTVFPSARYGHSISLESVQNACDQAKAAAAAMLGETVGYDPVPWFWSDQYHVKLQMAGLSAGFDRMETIGDPSAGRFSVRYFSDTTLIGVDSINDPRSHMLARREIAAQSTAIAA